MIACGIYFVCCYRKECRSWHRRFRWKACCRCPHPLVSSGWLMSRLFARDLELSCDEQALSAYGSSMQGRFSCSHKIKRKSRCFAVDFLKIRPKKGWSLL